MNPSSKRIHAEIAAVRKNLSDCGIFVTQDEKDTNKVHALIQGPLETPYENGLFFFTFTFPQDYPWSSPKAEIMTTSKGTVRFNPNLYSNGKVCLSILGTWAGPGWTPSLSFDKVLLSIQSLLGESPMQNEPGFESRSHGSEDYNDVIAHETLRISICEQLELIIGISSPTLAPSDLVVPTHGHMHGPALTSFGGGGGGHILGGGSSSGSSGGGSSSDGSSVSSAIGESNSIPQDRPPTKQSTTSSVPPPPPAFPEWMPEELCDKALELYAQRAAAISSKCFLQTKLDGTRTKDPFQDPGRPRTFMYRQLIKRLEKINEKMQLTATVSAAEQKRKLGRDRDTTHMDDLPPSSATASSSVSGGGGVDNIAHSSTGVGGVGVGTEAVESGSVAMVVVEDDVRVDVVHVHDPVVPTAVATTTTDGTITKNNTAGPQAKPPSPPSKSQSFNKLSFSEELMCGVCFDLLATPALFPECGHVFCCKCAFMSVQTNHREECPQCRTSVKTDNIVRLYTMDPLCAKAAVGLWGGGGGGCSSDDSLPTDPDHINWIARRDEGVKLFSGEIQLKNKKQKRNQHGMDFPPTAGMGFAPPFPSYYGDDEDDQEGYGDGDDDGDDDYNNQDDGYDNEGGGGGGGGGGFGPSGFGSFGGVSSGFFGGGRGGGRGGGGRGIGGRGYGPGGGGRGSGGSFGGGRGRGHHQWGGPGHKIGGGEVLTMSDSSSSSSSSSSAGAVSSSSLGTDVGGGLFGLEAGGSTIATSSLTAPTICSTTDMTHNNISSMMTAEEKTAQIRAMRLQRLTTTTTAAAATAASATTTTATAVTTTVSSLSNPSMASGGMTAADDVTMIIPTTTTHAANNAVITDNGEEGMIMFTGNPVTAREEDVDVDDDAGMMRVDDEDNMMSPEKMMPVQCQPPPPPAVVSLPDPGGHTLMSSSTSLSSSLPSSSSSSLPSSISAALALAAAIARQEASTPPQPPPPSSSSSSSSSSLVAALLPAVPLLSMNERDAKIQTAIITITRENRADVSSPALKVILSILRNILQHPLETKYRTINMAGKVFKERCGHVVGVLSLLTSLGFVSARTEQARMSRLKSTEGGDGTGITIERSDTAGGAAPSPSASAAGSSTGGGTVEGSSSEKGQGGASEAVPPRDDDNNNNKSKLTLSVATVCGEGDGEGDGTDKAATSSLPDPLLQLLTSAATAIYLRLNEYGDAT